MNEDQIKILSQLPKDLQGRFETHIAETGQPLQLLYNENGLHSAVYPQTIAADGQALFFSSNPSYNWVSLLPLS